MGMAFTKIPDDTFENIQMNAGVLLKNFDPSSTGALSLSDIKGATKGGITFTDTPSYIDMGEDIDNCPKNTMELKKYDSREIKMTGTYVTANKDLVKELMGSGTISGNKITPKDVLTEADFHDVWWVGDYGNVDGGYIAIHLKNVINTTGFQIKTADKEKTEFAFEYTAHYSIANQDEVPYEVYVKAGTPVSA